MKASQYGLFRFEYSAPKWLLLLGPTTDCTVFRNGCYFWGLFRFEYSEAAAAFDGVSLLYTALATAAATNIRAASRADLFGAGAALAITTTSSRREKLEGIRGPSPRYSSRCLL